MKITGKLRGDMIGLNLKHNPDNGTRLAMVKICVGCDRDRVRELFGPELERVAFSSLLTTGGDEETPATISFGYKKIDPDIICEYHELQIVGQRQNVQPVIKAIRPVKDKAEVTIDIEFPILIKKDKTLAGALATEFGEVIGIDLEPAQRELNLVDGGKGANPGVVIKKGAFGNPEPVAAG